VAWVRPFSHLTIAATSVAVLIAGLYIPGESRAAICTITGASFHRLSMLWPWCWYLVAVRIQDANLRTAVLSIAVMHFTAFCAVFFAFLGPLESLLNRLLVGWKPLGFTRQRADRQSCCPLCLFLLVPHSFCSVSREISWGAKLVRLELVSGPGIVEVNCRVIRLFLVSFSGVLFIMCEGGKAYL